MSFQKKRFCWFHFFLGGPSLNPVLVASAWSLQILVMAVSGCLKFWRDAPGVFFYSFDA